MSDIKISKHQIRDIDQEQVDKLETNLSKKLTISNLLAGQNITLDINDDKVTINSTGGGSTPSTGGNTDLSNYYTKSESNNRFASKTSEHIHENKSLLDLFSEDNGVLKYNGNVVPINPGQLEKTVTGNYDTETEIFDVRTICTTESYKALINSYLFIKNNAEVTPDLEEGQEDPNIATFTIYNNISKFDIVKLEPQKTQSYQLPAIFGIKVKAKGNITSELNLVGYCY